MFISNTLAAADSPVDFDRLKAAAEHYLKASGMAYSILRATPLMDLMETLFGDPIALGQKPRIFGSGTNPISFIAIDDVASFAVRALRQPEAGNRIITVGGPEARTTREIAETVASVTGKPLAVRALPMPLLRAMKVVLRPFNPIFARRIEQMIVLDTSRQVIVMDETLGGFPVSLTRREPYVRRRYNAA